MPSTQDIKFLLMVAIVFTVGWIIFKTIVLFGAYMFGIYIVGAISGIVGTLVIAKSYDKYQEETYRIAGRSWLFRVRRG